MTIISATVSKERTELDVFLKRHLINYIETVKEKNLKIYLDGVPSQFQNVFSVADALYSMVLFIRSHENFNVTEFVGVSATLYASCMNKVITSLKGKNDFKNLKILKKGIITQLAEIIKDIPV